MAIDISLDGSQYRWPTNGEDRPLIIGMAGGSGSGKTTIAKAVVAAVGADSVSLITHDAYYRDLRDLSLDERAAINFDHPDSLETELLVEHLAALRAGKEIERPTYDFSTHLRRSANGSVRIYLPAGAGGELDAQTVNGSITTDFPTTVTRVSRRHLKGSFGNGGGASYEIETVNGSVKILEN